MAPGGSPDFERGVVSTNSHPWLIPGLASGGIDNNYLFPEWESDDYYIRLSGTSMAAPHVTGLFAKMEQWNPDMPAELMKAILINRTIPIKENAVDSASSWGGYANTRVGYGLANAFSVTDYYEGESVQLLSTSGSVSESDLQDSWAISVPSGADKLVVTLAYDDKGGETSNSNALIHDLDLKLTSPTGVSYYAHSYKAPGVTTESPLEKMIVLNPTQRGWEAGNWQVTVEFTDALGFWNPLIYSTESYGIVADAILMTPELTLSVVPSATQLVTGQPLTLNVTVTNTGGYIAAGVNVKIEESYYSGYATKIQYRYLDNLMFQNDAEHEQFDLEGQNAPGIYEITVSADGVNREFSSGYPITQMLTFDVTYPPEVCDGNDNDFDGQTDEGCDDDNDNYCDAGMGVISVIGLPKPCPFGGGDCNDNDASIYPGAPEVCDGADNDCDGNTDEGGNALCDNGLFCDGAETCGGSAGCQPGSQPCSDGSICTTDSCNEETDSCENVAISCDDGDLCTTDSCNLSRGCIHEPVSCDDGDACTDDSCDPLNGCINELKTEVCDDGLDNDCDGAVDGDDSDCKPACTDNDGYAIDGGDCGPIDCDDADATTNPGAVELCGSAGKGDGKDNNCNGQIDEGCNSCPVANAGPDQTALVGADVRLDGTGSSDYDGDPLTYLWEMLSWPGGCLAPPLDDPTLVRPSFKIECFGSYTIELVVNDGICDSAPDAVTVSTLNSCPVANAGTDQSAHAGETIHLDGSASSDADGNALTYAWSLISKPEGSSAALSGSTLVNPTFVADLVGVFVVQLVVNDGICDSPPDTIVITTENVCPVANAGIDQAAYAGDTVQLDGGASSDVDGDPLSHFWSILSKPACSAAELSNAFIVAPTFVPDCEGDYVIQLIVGDGICDSAPDTCVVTASQQFACPKNTRFWEKNPALWPVNSLSLGSHVYSKAELMTILSAPARTDASVILAQQLVATKLNIDHGSDPDPIAATVDSADAKLSAYPGKLPYQVRKNTPMGKAMQQDANQLNAYNSGALTPDCQPW